MYMYMYMALDYSQRLVRIGTLGPVQVGVFILIQMLLLQGLIAFIPSAVFGGILFKVGYDVMDWPPIFNGLGQIKARITGSAYEPPDGDKLVTGSCAPMSAGLS
jgi:hypothetical protein